MKMLVFLVQVFDYPVVNKIVLQDCEQVILALMVVVGMVQVLEVADNMFALEDYYYLILRDMLVVVVVVVVGMVHYYCYN